MDINILKSQLEKSIESFKNELAGLRAGRASTQLVEGLKIDYYGNPTPLNQMSQINTPDAKTIMITPWNKDDLSGIEKAINESDLGLTPNNNGASIILNIPGMTQERRVELAKVVGHKAEECRVSLRQKREREVDSLNDQKKNNTISEDEFFTKKEEVQKVLDEYIKKVEEIKEAKEKEIITL